MKQHIDLNLAEFPQELIAYIMNMAVDVEDQELTSDYIYELLNTPIKE